MTVEEQPAKILYRLLKAQNKAAQHDVVIDQLARNKTLQEEEAKRLHGQLKVVERDHRLQVQRAAEGARLDPDAPIPWFPVGGRKLPDRHAERKMRIGDDVNMELTFKPRITRMSDLPTQGDLAETLRSAVQSGFAQLSIFKRLEYASKKREDIKEEIEGFEREANEAEMMAGINDAAEDIHQDRGKKKPTVFTRQSTMAPVGYWVPGGEGYNHKKPKGQGEESSIGDMEAYKLSFDVRFLERRLAK
eukprot:gene4519-14681_t